MYIEIEVFCQDCIRVLLCTNVFYENFGLDGKFEFIEINEIEETVGKFTNYVLQDKAWLKHKVQNALEGKIKPYV